MNINVRINLVHILLTSLVYIYSQLFKVIKKLNVCLRIKKYSKAKKFLIFFYIFNSLKVKMLVINNFN